ncbi:hypothetical protein Poli38472_012766 [Pythium oligandrum]|uniref:Myb-like domain-containing protein n=1 Tax=Pythium oligandrum TaxID=41045 RepID=A0A8K1FFF0_PYTOL|nr:hypothetical protein Poli38472_012766 [Pythium oligandrum]|eukprot:TMW61575.1 hypothetical protein Poli38472_012766 [Pythium oligandrum]
MSDVAQILGLNGPGGGASGANTGADAVAKELESLKPTAAGQKPKKASGKKLTGMQREVLELLESNHRVNHALYPGFNKLTLQQKWRERKDRPAVKWLRKSFRNPARAELAGEQEHQGGLTLSHWVKAHIDPPDYVFARFNVKCDVFKYTDEEFTSVLANHEDPQMKWTKEETDALFTLCERFDLRWVVIADKYNAHPAAKDGPTRSVEDIKYRYYEVVRLVSEARDRRARNGEKTEGETGNAAMEEAKNESDTNSAEATPEKTSSAQTSATDSPPSKYYRFNVTYEKQRKRQLELAFTRTTEEENELRRLNDELRTVEQQLKKVAVKVDPKKKKELSDVPYEIHREYPKGVHLRSSTLALPQQSKQGASVSTKMLKKMEVLLEEMGVPARPMPTKLTCEVFDSLRQDSIGLLSLRKHLVAKQAEVQTLKERYQTLTGKEYEPIAPPPPARKTGRRASVLGAGSGITAINGTPGMDTAPTHISKGKSLKTSEKQPRSSNKRRGATSSHGIPSKRNKKIL